MQAEPASCPRPSNRWLLARIPDFVGLLGGGHLAVAADAVRRRLYQDSTSVGLRRDVSLPADAPPAKIALQVRPLRPEDNLSFLDLHRPGISGREMPSLLAERRLLKAALGICWVALAPGERICFVGWLIPASSNALVQRHFGDLFPRLEQDEVLLEGLLTLPPDRGQGIMTHALARMVAAARRQGARSAIAFVESTNTASLRGFQRAGFAPYATRHERWRLLRRRVVFETLA